MSEFKGTKGEWGDRGGDNISIDIILPNSAVITVSRYHRYKDEFAMSREEMEANAKLIASAPDLLSALEELMECYNKKGHLLDFNVNVARTAIKKATE